MVKAAPVSVRFEQETRAGLEKAAREDKRSLTSMLEKITSDWLREHGYDQPPKPARGGRPRKPKAQALEAPA